MENDGLKRKHNLIQSHFLYLKRHNKTISPLVLFSSTSVSVQRYLSEDRLFMPCY